jgi:nicotinate-nucleotide pyrophosphorylase (carboxylating)
MNLPIEAELMKKLVRGALAEDLGTSEPATEATSDLTTAALVPKDGPGRAEIKAKATGVVAGGFIAAEVFRQTGAVYEELVNDGSGVTPGTLVGRVKGSLRALLHGERTALNLLARLSGIATQTRRFVDGAKGSRARILDTRKTTPLYRSLEKYAVRMGGGTNHRMGLSDQVLVKENHIYAAKASGAAGNFDGAIRLLIKAMKPDTLVGIEVTNLSELHIALEAHPAYILCDNFSLEDLDMAVRIRNDWPGEGRPEIEASGGVNLDNVAAVAATGVDRISVGALTHSAPALDLSMKIVVD